MINWRDDPATERQKNYLLRNNISFSNNITKGETSDLIGTNKPHEEETINILRFFKVKNIASLNHTQANLKIGEIFSKEDNKIKWENRSATNEQKEIYKFFNIEIKNRLTFKEAEKVIENLQKDEKTWEKWEQYDSELDEHKSMMDDIFELIADYRDLSNCRKISRKLFNQTIQSLVESGITLEQLESEVDYKTIYQKAIELQPDIIIRRNKTKQTHKNSIVSFLWNLIK